MQVESRERTGYDYVSTGRLPAPEMVKSLVSEAYERFKSNAEGCSSDVYEALARVPSVRATNATSARSRRWVSVELGIAASTRLMSSRVGPRGVRCALATAAVAREGLKYSQSPYLNRDLKPGCAASHMKNVLKVLRVV
jgi:hypothetical protein